MEVIRFFCVILACSLLLAQTCVAQTADPNITTTTESTSTISTKTSPSSTETSTSETTTQSSSLSTESSTKTSEAKTTENATVTTPPPTTPVPSTTPAPPQFTWELHDTDENKTVCLKVHLEITFKNTNGSDTFLLPTNASVGDKSSCGKNNSSQVLILTYEDKSVTLKFDKATTDKETSKFYLSYLTFTNGSAMHSLNGSGEMFMVGHLQKSYKCDDDETQDMVPSDEIVTWKNVQVQAFMDQADKGGFGTAEECSQDNTSDIVPIAVGCALAGLVVVVLIAYLVGRRRSRQKGYQSV